jgi:hypothetical protein
MQTVSDQARTQVVMIFPVGRFYETPVLAVFLRDTSARRLIAISALILDINRNSAENQLCKGIDEPGTLSLAGVGLVSILGMMLLRHRGIRIG